MSSVIFIRHGESIANVDTRYYRHPDCAIVLSQKGVDQCLDLSDKIGSLMEDDWFGKYTTVIASRMLRTQLTANIVMSKSRHHFPVHVDARINETHHTALEVVTETDDHVRARVRSLVEEHHTNLILFTHGMLMRSVEPAKGHALNCEVRKYDREELLDVFLAEGPRVWTAKDVLLG